MRMLPALAFVPPELVSWSFQQLIMTFPENLFPLCKYFEENYIGILNLNGERILLSIQYLFGTIFTLFHKACRQVNLIEAWHRGF